MNLGHVVLAHLKFEGGNNTLANPLMIHGLQFCGCTHKYKRSNSPVIHSAYHTSLFSLFLCPLSLSLSVCLRVLVFVFCVECVVCVVWCVARLGTQKKPPCADSKRPCVHRHHAHMCYHMRAWCPYTRGRIESTHGGFLDGHTGERGERRRGGREEEGLRQFC